MSDVILFTFAPHVPLAEAEMSLHLAIFAVEGLVGRAQVRLNANYQIDASKHAIAIDGGNHVGQMIAHVFAEFLLREFGEHSIHIARVQSTTEQSITNHQPDEVHT